MPDLWTYYGTVLALESTPNGTSSIRLRLHPDCQRTGATEAAQDEIETGWEAESGLRRPRRFGEDSLAEDMGSPQDASEKTIQLDDIVDCRRIYLM